MSAKELDRVGVMARVGSGELKLVQAAGLLGVSYRQAKRLRKVFRERGALGLKHGNAGRRSHNAVEEKEREEMLRLGREHYGGGGGGRFGPHLAAGHLEQGAGVTLPAGAFRRSVAGA